MEMTETSEKKYIELAKQMGELKKQKADLEVKVNNIDAELDQVKLELTKLMVELEVSNFKIEGIGTFYLATRVFTKINNEQELISWLDMNGKSNIAPRKVHAPSLKEMIESNLEKDQPIPAAEMVELNTDTSVRLRSSAKVKGE